MDERLKRLGFFESLDLSKGKELIEVEMISDWYKDKRERG
jgi:hypothetical protein